MNPVFLRGLNERFLRNNLPMADVPLYVAIITAAAGIVGAAIPQVAIMIRDVRQGERDRRERSATATRDACVELLRAAGELRTLSEGIRSYRGKADGMRARVDEVRERAAATGLSAARVSLQAAALETPAYAVASAASDLAHAVVDGTDMDQGVFVGKLDVSTLEKSASAFRDEAVKYARSLPRTTLLLLFLGKLKSDFPVVRRETGIVSVNRAPGEFFRSALIAIKRLRSCGVQ